MDTHQHQLNPPPNRSSSPAYIQKSIGWVLLAAWAAWWAGSFFAGYLVGPDMWVPHWVASYQDQSRELGRDFAHNFYAVHIVHSGGDPYVTPPDDRGTYAYPPLVLGLFYWGVLIPVRFIRLAAGIWSLLIALIVMGATHLALRGRRSLGLNAISWPLAQGLALWCTPVVFAMERGNCDALVLGLIALAAIFLARKSKWGDALAGLCLAGGMWIKIYPGLVLVAALALRRWRMAGWSLVFSLLIPVLMWSGTMQFLHSGWKAEGYRTKFLSSAAHLQEDPNAAAAGVNSYPPLEAVSHSLPIYWKTFWSGVGMPAVGRIPGLIGAGIVLGPMLMGTFLVMWWANSKQNAPHPSPLPEYRERGQERGLAFAYFLWVAMAATFWMPVSYDYNLIYFPVLLAAVWAVRDGMIVHALLALGFVYWQPLAQGVPKELILLFKLLALVALGICLVRRAKENFATDEHRYTQIRV